MYDKQKLIDEVWFLRSRLAEVEKERDELKCKNTEMFFEYEAEDRAHESALAKLGNELFKVKEQRDTYKTIAEEAVSRVKEQEKELLAAKAEKTWGCGHTNHGSCSQCLGHVTNERNALRSKLEGFDVIPAPIGIQKILLGLSDDQRLEAIRNVCFHCGADTTNKVCHCSNDE